MNNFLSKKVADRDNAKMSLNPPFPRERFSIELTNICNHKCIFCPHNGKMTRRHGIINEQFFKRILVEAYKLGSREICIGANGETFIVKNLADYISFAKKIGYSYVFINTNGALATPERMKEVIDAGLDSIRFSINAGNRNTYKDIHGEDDFEKVKENLLFCIEYRNAKINKAITSPSNTLWDGGGGGGMNVFISFVANKYNISEVDDLKREFYELVDEIIFMRVRNIGGYMPEIKDMINNDVLHISSTHENCVFPFNGVMVTWEGYLTACCLDWQNYLAVADLNKTSLYEAWYGENMQKLRKRFIDNNFTGTICQLCKNREYIEPKPLVKELCCEFNFK